MISLTFSKLCHYQKSNNIFLFTDYKDYIFTVLLTSVILNNSWAVIKGTNKRKKLSLLGPAGRFCTQMQAYECGKTQKCVIIKNIERFTSCSMHTYVSYKF